MRRYQQDTYPISRMVGYMRVDPYPIHADWYDSLLKEKKEKLCSQVLKNPPPVRNSVIWSRHLLFIFVFTMEKIK